MSGEAIARRGGLTHALEAALAASIAVLVLTVAAQVALRYLTDQPLAWTEELSRFVFIWACFLGAVLGSQRGSHFVVDILLRSLPAQAAAWMRLAVTLMECAFYLVLGWSGYRVGQVASLQQSSSLDISMGIPYAAIPVGAMLMAMYTSYRAVHILQKL